EGIPAVCGADAIRIDLSTRSFTANGTKVDEGDLITIDGFSGAVYVGELELEESKIEKARAGDAEAREEAIWKAFDRIMSAADARRRDPPLHEFLPNQVEVATRVARLDERGEYGPELEEQKALLAKVSELHEDNPMLGLRGVRLGIVKPGLYAMQVRAIVEAACAVKKEGGDPRVEIMIPLVATRPELQQMRDELEPVARDVFVREGRSEEHTSEL